jgi:transcriptional regulator GlxA family with amidase domain
MAPVIGIALFDGAEELDWAGPWEVLSNWATTWPGDGVSVFTLAQKDAPVTCAKGLRVLPDHTWESSPRMDVLVYPGGQGTRAQIHDGVVGDWVRNLALGGVLMTSVCTGSLVYAGAGLLANRPATTHWASLDLLASIDPSIEVVRTARFVDDDDIVTAAGVSAGIDMALHLVARLGSAERARAVRRDIQYDPEPPV